MTATPSNGGIKPNMAATNAEDAIAPWTIHIRFRSDGPEDAESGSGDRYGLTITDNFSRRATDPIPEHFFEKDTEVERLWIAAQRQRR